MSVAVAGRRMETLLVARRSGEEHRTSQNVKGAEAPREVACQGDTCTSVAAYNVTP
jgi:hypothetical protein